MQGRQSVRQCVVLKLAGVVQAFVQVLDDAEVGCDARTFCEGQSRLQPREVEAAFVGYCLEAVIGEKSVVRYLSESNIFTREEVAWFQDGKQ